MNKPCKYAVGRKLWTVLDCDPVECIVLRTGNNIVGDPEYLVQPDKSNRHFDQQYWTAEDRLYDNELDAVKEAQRLWDDKHKKAVEEADYILSHKISYLMMRKAELEEQRKQSSLNGQILTSGYHEVNTDKCYSSVTVKGGAKIGINGGFIECLHIADGGIVHMQSGRLDKVRVKAQAKLTVDGGYIHSAAVAAGAVNIVGRHANTPYVEQAVLCEQADVYLCNAIASGFWVRENSMLRLGNGAVAYDTFIGATGKVYITSGASMKTCQVASGGTLTMVGSAVHIEELTINEGGIVRYLEKGK